MKGIVFIIFVIVIIGAMAFQKSAFDHFVVLGLLLLAIFASLKWRQ